MKTILRTLIVGSVLLLLVASAFGQQLQFTGLTTIAGDSVNKIQCKSVEYLPSGVIWIQAADVPYAQKDFAYLSTDHGATWVKRMQVSNPAYGGVAVCNIVAKDANTALIGLRTGEILRTTNGGVKWDTVASYADGDGWMDGVRYVGQDTLVAYGDAISTDPNGVYLARSVDGGATWTRFTNLPGDSLKIPGLYAGSFTYGQAMESYGKTAWASLYNTSNDPPSILKTTDGGTTWSWFRVTLPSGPAQNYIINSITFKNENVGFVVGRRAYGSTTAFNNYLCKSTDGGRTWSDTISVEPNVGHINAKPMTVRAIRGTNIVVAGGFGTAGAKAWLSTDEGLTWTSQSPPSLSVNADYRNLAFGSATKGIMVGNLAIALFTVTNPVTPAQYLGDDFNWPAGTPLLSANWYLGNSTTNPLMITSPGLTFPGHPGSGVGGAVSMLNTGQDDYRPFAPVNSGDVYLSFLMNVSAVQTGDYFIALGTSSAQFNYIARLFLKSSGAGFNVGISKSNETPQQYGTTVYNLNTTYLVAVKYSFAGPAADSANSTSDPISVYVVPSGSSIASEPTPEINGYLHSGKNDAADLASVTLRQGSTSSAATLTVDAIRVGNTWEAATSAAVDYANVTFLANTATVPDTLKPGSFVQIRGSADVFGPWGMSSKTILSNIAGDYWKGTARLKVGDTIQYKFFTNAVSPLPLSAEHQGWEQNSTDASGNRILIVGRRDTSLPLQFVNGTPDNKPQYFKPYVDQADSIDVWFRVNMAGQESFNKATQFMGVRGGFAGSDWGKSIVLKREDQHGNGGSRQYDGTNFWSGSARLPKSAFTSNVEYKFVILKTAEPAGEIIAWEDGLRAAPDAQAGGNRLILTTPGVSDTTLYWKWWANNPFVPFVGQDTVIVTVRANLSRAIAERGFAFGDTLQVRTGYGGTAKEVRTKALTRSGLTGTIFTTTDTVIAALNKDVNYQYYVVKSGNDVREVFYDFDDASGGSQAERRKMKLTSKSMTVNDTTSTSFDLRRMPRFRNTAKLSKAVAVRYTVDVRPAYYTVKSGKKLVATNISQYTIGNADSVITWGVWMNGPAVGGWDTRGAWGAARRADSTSKMHDDGTHGDLVKNDSVYSLVWNYTTADFLGQEFKFGVGGFDNEGGFGNNHIENIDDAAATYTIASQFGSIDPKFFNAWNFDLKKPQTPTAVDDQPAVPLVYQLSQNYPNPFNPSTTIQFYLPTQSIVTLKVFNVLGQEIMTVLNEKLGSGNHTVKFDASKLTSGVYLYQINAGTFTDTKKMILLK